MIKPIKGIEQIAYFVKGGRAELDAAKENFKALGCVNWTDDTVTAKGTVFGVPVKKSVGNLSFCYDIPGVELELLNYAEGKNWHQERLVEMNNTEKAGVKVDFANNIFLSHMGYHVDDAVAEASRLGYPIAQELFTQEHTNEYLTTGKGAGRKYHYIVFDTVKELGFDLKIIQRINPEV